jgi:hypothetical protein
MLVPAKCMKAARRQGPLAGARGPPQAIQSTDTSLVTTLWYSPNNYDDPPLSRRRVVESIVRARRPRAT